MSVKAIMSTPVISVELDDTLNLVYNIFSQTQFHHLVVVENKKLYGVVSDRNLFKALSPNIGTAAEKLSDKATLNKKVHQIMTRKPIFLSQNAGIYEAIEVFGEHRISCIPVVDENQFPIGILTWRDIFKAIMKHRTACLKE